MLALANNIITEEMEVYTAEEVANLVDESDAETDSDSEIDEDPDFPLPRDSDDEGEPTLPLSTHSPQGSCPEINKMRQFM